LIDFITVRTRNWTSWADDV